MDDFPMRPGWARVEEMRRQKLKDLKTFYEEKYAFLFPERHQSGNGNAAVAGGGSELAAGSPGGHFKATSSRHSEADMGPVEGSKSVAGGLEHTEVCSHQNGSIAVEHTEQPTSSCISVNSSVVQTEPVKKSSSKKSSKISAVEDKGPQPATEEGNDKTEVLCSRLSESAVAPGDVSHVTEQGKPSRKATPINTSVLGKRLRSVSLENILSGVSIVPSPKVMATSENSDSIKTCVAEQERNTPVASVDNCLTHTPAAELSAYIPATVSKVDTPTSFIPTSTPLVPASTSTSSSTSSSSAATGSTLKSRVLDAIFAKKATPVPVVVAEVKSFIPAKAKDDNRSVKPAATLKEKIQKKQKEEAKRMEEIEEKKRQQLQQKKQQREERARKVAEKQAALEQERQDKKRQQLQIKKQQRDDRAKKMAEGRAKKAAAEEKARKAAEERAKKVAEKQAALEQERLEKKKRMIEEAEERRLAAEARRKQEIEAQEKKAKAIKDEEKKAKSNKEEKKEGVKEDKKQESKAADGKLYHHIERLMATPVSSPNRTFVVKDGPDSEEREPEPISSYDITLVNDPIMEVENYDIGDLSSEDSTDDEDCPKKPVPQWVKPDNLQPRMEEQEEDMEMNKDLVNEIFPPRELLQDCNLNKIFRLKRKRFYHRTSSAIWNSPMVKQFDSKI